MAETATEAARARLAALARDREHLGRGDIAYIFAITLRAAESRVRYELAHAAEAGADAYPGERVPLVPLPDVRIEQGPRRTLRFWTPAAVDRFLDTYGAEASDPDRILAERARRATATPPVVDRSQRRCCVIA